METGAAHNQKSRSELISRYKGFRGCRNKSGNREVEMKKVKVL